MDVDVTGYGSTGQHVAPKALIRPLCYVNDGSR